MKDKEKVLYRFKKKIIRELTKLYTDHLTQRILKAMRAKTV